MLSRDDPRCGVIPNACGALIGLNSHMERNPAKKPFLREKQKSLKTLAVMQNYLVISFFMYLSEILR
jgi:hypothetical protein